MTAIGPGDSSSSDLIIYPSEHIRTIAAKILTEASYAQSQHDIAWNQFQNYVHRDCAPGLQDPMLNCTKPYGERLRSSYDWLMDKRRFRVRGPMNWLISWAIF